MTQPCASRTIPDHNRAGTGTVQVNCCGAKTPKLPRRTGKLACVNAHYLGNHRHATLKIGRKPRLKARPAGNCDGDPQKGSPPGANPPVAGEDAKELARRYPLHGARQNPRRQIFPEAWQDERSCQVHRKMTNVPRPQGFTRGWRIFATMHAFCGLRRNTGYNSLDLPPQKPQGRQ